MIFTIWNNARKNATMSGVFWVVSGGGWGPQGLQMFDSWSVRVDEIDICGGVGICMNSGRQNMIFIIQNNAWESAAMLGVFWVVSGL